MTLEEHSFVVFVYDKHGNPIPDAAVEVTLEGEPIAGASTIGDPSSPIHVHLSADVTVVGLRAIAGGVTKEVTVDVDVGNFTFAFPEVEVSSPPSRSNVPPAPWVLTLHGILTRGAWQKQLSSYLNASGAKHEALDYGWFDAISFLIPAIRRRQVGAEGGL